MYEAMRHPDPLEIIDLAAGRLPKDRQGEIAAHLSACQECRFRYEEACFTWRALGKWTVQRSSTDLWVRVQAALGHDGPARIPSAWRLRWAVRVAAAVLIGVGIGHGLGRWTMPQASTTTPQAGSADLPRDAQAAARWLYLTSLESHTPAGLAGVILGMPNDVRKEVTE